VDIALILGAHDSLAHRDPSRLHGKFTKQTNGHKQWLERLDKSFNKSKEEFAKHFKIKYSGQHPPIWIAIELWDFGMLSVLLDGMKRADLEKLAVKYRLPRVEFLTSWTRNINNVRNICAHHSRLWNRSPADQAVPPKAGEILLLDHLALDTFAQSRIYATTAILQFLLNFINPMSTWKTRLKEQIACFPAGSGINVAQSGFPRQWEELQLWK
jgi:abortive infection bacteriophage resistance protein